MRTGRNIAHESEILGILDEELGNLEKDFIINLSEAIEVLYLDKKKISYVNLSKILKISPKELSDYDMEIINIENLLIKRYEHDGKDIKVKVKKRNRT